jgi:hypothetical protein
MCLREGYYSVQEGHSRQWNRFAAPAQSDVLDVIPRNPSAKTYHINIVFVFIVREVGNLPPYTAKDTDDALFCCDDAKISWHQKLWEEKVYWPLLRQLRRDVRGVDALVKHHFYNCR